jgi:hypothetical protein
MIPKGDTTSYDVADWAHNQAAYLGSNHLLMLLVLCHQAFYRQDNPEGVPVGQVMTGYSAVPVLADWTGFSERTVLRLLESLQAQHGYLRRLPRHSDARSGRQTRIIRLYWTTEHDAMRAVARSGGVLPDPFLITARQFEIRDRIPRLHVVRDEVEQVQTTMTE